MLNRKLLLVASLLAALTISAFAAQPGTDLLFQFPASDAQSTRFVAYDAAGSPMATLIDTNGQDGIHRVLALPDGSGFYLVSNGPVQAVNADFTQSVNITGIIGNIKQVKLTPDGKLLLILADELYVVDTSTNAVVAHGFNIGSTQSDFAISQDSTRAWVIADSGFLSALITIDLTTLTRVGSPFALPLRGLSITTAPSGLLYISYAGRVDALDPETLQVIPNGTFGIVAQAISPLRFTPDGKYAYYANLTPNAQGRTLQRLDIMNGKVDTWPSFSLGSQPPPFTDVVVAGNDRVFAHSASDLKLWDVMTDTLSADETSLKSLFPADQVLAVTASTEIPSSRFLYVLLQNGVQTNVIRVDLGNNNISASNLAAFDNGMFQFVEIPPQTGASSFIKTGDNQVLQPSQTSGLIKIQVLDVYGRPVYNLPVTLSTSSASGLQLQDTTLVTDAHGYIRTKATVPDGPGTYIINVNAVTANTTITLVVPQPGGGGGTPNVQPRIIISSGNGQLLEEFHSVDGIPLVVETLDENGNPQGNVPVHFEVVDGANFLNIYLDTYSSGGGPGDTQSDMNGFARAYPQPYQVPQSTSFAAATIRATTPNGSVDFKLTVFRKPSTVPVPLIIREKPQGLSLAIGQGDVIPNAIQYHVYATAPPNEGQPIPFVGQRTKSLTQGEDPLAVCVNSTLSDNNGLTSCDLKAVCLPNADFRDFGLGVIVGWKQERFTLSIGPGTASMLTKVSGDGLTGRTGNQVGPLVAKVSDNCGLPKSGVVGQFEIISGDATVTNATSTTPSSGKLQTNVVFGQIPGNIVVRLTVPNADPIDFTLTSQVVVSKLELSSGAGQSALVNQPFANPIVFRLLDAANNPVQNTAVTFSVSGNGSVSTTQGTTNSQGLVQVNATAGNAAGTLTVTAMVGNLSAAATLTVLPPGPMLTSQDIFNAGSFEVGLVSCSLTTAKGSGIAPNVTAPGVSGVSYPNPLPYVLAGVSVQVNGIPAPIQSVVPQGSEQQVTFQTPCGLTGNTATVKVTSGNASTTVTGVPLFNAQPGVFTYAGAGGIQYAYVIRAADSTYIRPDNLAHRGERYYLVLTGLGQTTPAIQTDQPGRTDVAQDVNLHTIVGLDDRGLPVISSRYVPGQIGLYTVEFEIPADHPVGTDQSFVIAVQTADGQVIFGNSVFLPGVQ